MNFRLLLSQFLWALLPTMALCLGTTALSLGPTGPVQAQDPFSTNIRPTAALTPNQEQKALHVPPGFEVQLFAAEPDLQKPMNLAFDARGRLWVSGSVEYPFAASLDSPGRDAIKILEDTDGDGRADKITTFADGLNIPIGLYPYKRGVIAYGIPNIYYFEDTDGDDHADKRHVLYGPFDYSRDTHGMNNAFRRGNDGWIYACHGWANQDTIAGTDGHAIRMEGGNTFRFRADGARVESYTFGQVNPFGMVVDPRGDIFTADCHTKPIMLLVRGGYHESFGKPNDGLGFIPDVMSHLHGSTAIAGTTVYAAENFPPAYRGCMLAGNVMTSRVNCDAIEHAGSSPRAIEQPDFITSDDPWFRPVDLQVGPDGALYVADFYNRIIGHYEVPLDHPGRDRQSGRIWRIVYTGSDPQTPRHERAPNLAIASVEELVAALTHANLTVRRLATDELTDRCGLAAAAALREATHGASPTQRVHSLWSLFRLGKLTPAELQAASADQDVIVRTHVMRMLAETQPLAPELAASLLAGLSDADPFVRRAAADACGQHEEIDAVQPLLDLLAGTPTGDVQLRHVARIALRNQLRVAGRLGALRTTAPERQAIVADVLLGLTTDESLQYLMAYLHQTDFDLARWVPWVQHAAQYLPSGELPALIGCAHDRTSGNPQTSLALLAAIEKGVQLRGLQPLAELAAWSVEVIERLLASQAKATTAGWHVAEPNPSTSSASSWPTELRTTEDGQSFRFLSSLPLGEQYRGVLRSTTFALPRRFSFYVCGHLGTPVQPAIGDSRVRLKLQSTGEVLHETPPPRNDIAKRVEWDLNAHVGQEAYLEVVDGVDALSYAWIAVGRFDPPLIGVPDAEADAHLQQAVGLIGRLKLTDYTGKLQEILICEWLAPKTRAAAAQALVSFRPQADREALSSVLDDELLAEAMRNRLSRAIAGENVDDAHALLIELMRTAPERLQTSLAWKMSQRAATADLLLAMIEQSIAPERLLQSRTLLARLRLANPPGGAERIDAIVSRLPPINAALAELVAQRRRNFAATPDATAAGRELFVKHCAGCHQVGGVGAVVGPQLDGIGKRGAERVIEDVLDPNRNVDPAFRMTVYALQDGRVVSGLFRRVAGGQTILADSAGKELAITTDEIDEERKTANSLMPDNFGETLSADDFNRLIAFLIAPSETPSSEISASDPAGPRQQQK